MNSFLLLFILSSIFFSLKTTVAHGLLPSLSLWSNLRGVLACVGVRAVERCAHFLAQLVEMLALGRCSNATLLSSHFSSLARIQQQCPSTCHLHSRPDDMPASSTMSSTKGKQRHARLCIYTRPLSRYTGLYCHARLNLNCSFFKLLTIFLSLFSPFFFFLVYFHIYQSLKETFEHLVRKYTCNTNL